MEIRIGNYYIKLRKDALPLLIVASLSYYPITYTINQLVNRYIQYGAWWDSAICIGLYLLIVIGSIPIVLKRQKIFSLIFTISMVLVFIITILSNFDGTKYASDEIVPFFTKYLPFLFVGIAINEYEQLDKWVDAVTKIVLVAAFIWILIVVLDLNRNIRTPYMQISYYVLPSSLFRVYFYYRDRGAKNLLWMILGIANHIIWGTRGPILFLLLFIPLCLLSNNRSIKKIILSIVLILFGIVLYVRMYDILLWANSLFSSLGLRNAGIIKMMAEDLSDGRIDLFSQIMPYINNHFIFGGGIYSDRALLGVYVHLLPLEFMCDFGAIFGTLLFIVLIFLIIKKIVQLKDYRDFRWGLLWVLIFSGFIKLFFSSSYLEEPYFYFLLGLLVNDTMINTTHER